MVSNTNKKPAMSLLEILILMSMLMIALAVSVPVITKRSQKFTTGRNTADAININTPRGYFLCYYDTSNNLKQTRVDILPNGDTSRQTPTIVSECTFEIPQRAEFFELTLVGGGGGGGAPWVSTYKDKIVSTESLNFGLNGVMIAPMFKEYANLISQHNIKTGLEKLFKNALIVFEGATAPAYNNSAGGAGARCQVTMGSIGEVPDSGYNISYSSGTNADPDGKLNIAGSEFTAKAGLSANIEYGGGTLGISACYSNPSCWNTYTPYYTNLGTGLCRGTSTGGHSITSLNSDTANYTKYEDYKAGQSPKITILPNNSSTTTEIYPGQSLNFNIINNGIKLVEAGGGLSGEIKTYQVTYLNKQGIDVFTIPANSIGKGGAGGVKSTSSTFDANTIKGADGTATVLNITTNTGTLTLTANGGKGGQAFGENYIQSETGKSSIPAKVIPGRNGTIASFNVPSEIKSGMLYLTEGLGAFTCSSGANNCNATPATLPGAGGGSGAVYYSVSAGAETRMSMQHEHSYCDVIDSNGVSNIETSCEEKSITADLNSGNGSKGANGAILIKW